MPVNLWLVHARGHDLYVVLALAWAQNRANSTLKRYASSSGSPTVHVQPSEDILGSYTTDPIYVPSSGGPITQKMLERFVAAEMEDEYCALPFNHDAEYAVRGQAHPNTNLKLLLKEDTDSLFLVSYQVPKPFLAFYLSNVVQ